MKNKATILSIVYIFGLLIAIIPNHAKAATMPAHLWTDDGYVYVSVADLGMLVTCEWELLVIADWPGLEHIGIVMRFYHPEYQEFGMSCLSDGFWLMHWMGGVWSGDGTVAYGLATKGISWECHLYTSPPASAATLSLVFQR